MNKINSEPGDLRTKLTRELENLQAPSNKSAQVTTIRALDRKKQKPTLPSADSRLSAWSSPIEMDTISDFTLQTSQAKKDDPAKFLDCRYQGSILTGNLRVAPFDITELLDIKITQKVNEHSTLWFKAILSEEQGDSYVELPVEGKTVALKFEDISGAQYTLFQGIIEDAEVTMVGKTYQIEAHIVSYSSLLDVKERSRSFQSKELSYTILAWQVLLTGYPGGAVIDVATGGEATNKFIMQYMETDWEFLKRLASRFHTGLVCDPRFGAPKIYFGVPQVQCLELDTFEYSIKKDLKQYKKLSENGAEDLREHDFICYKVETPHVVGIGDEIIFQGKKLYVCEIASVASKGILVNRLTLMAKKGLCQPYIPHKNVAGTSLGGKIIDVQNDRVKVFLDTDHGHDPGFPCWFPYSTIYSSSDGSGWYCMPEILDTIRLHFPDADDDDHAYVISSVHEQVDPALMHQQGGGGGGGPRSDPAVKTLRSACGKVIQLCPKGIVIDAGSSTIALTDAGVEIASESDITFKSDQKIVMSAEAEIQVAGSECVDLAGGGASVKVEDDVELKGAEVKSN